MKYVILIVGLTTAALAQQSFTNTVTPSSACGAGVSVQAPQDLDVGVYIQQDACWQPLLPEIVNWKTGGVLKSVATHGIVKGDINGHINGKSSRNSLHSPVKLLIYAPEGTEYTEYQLIHLRENSHSREFRTVTGGVFHQSGGATRDVLPFEAQHAGKRMWAISLASLPAGEYGFLPPGAVAARSSASIGKMYTFRLN
jgi:hypothetical protein